MTGFTSSANNPNPSTNKVWRSMPRRTRRQLVGKQEDTLRRQREEALSELERELHESEAPTIPLPVVSEKIDLQHLWRSE
jgi:hypothetical protein